MNRLARRAKEAQARVTNGKGHTPATVHYHTEFRELAEGGVAPRVYGLAKVHARWNRDRQVIPADVEPLFEPVTPENEPKTKKTCVDSFRANLLKLREQGCYAQYPKANRYSCTAEVVLLSEPVEVYAMARLVAQSADGFQSATDPILITRPLTEELRGLISKELMDEFSAVLAGMQAST